MPKLLWPIIWFDSARARFQDGGFILLSLGIAIGTHINLNQPGSARNAKIMPQPWYEPTTFGRQRSENYVDITEVTKHYFFVTWILNSSYRNLLDAWRLWVHRAKLDILVNASHPPPQQVFITCNFCKKSISAYLQGMKKSGNTGPGGNKYSGSGKYAASPNKHKVRTYSDLKFSISFF